MLENMRIFTGNANPDLAKKICNKLGIIIGQANISVFSDGETRIEINENVRGMNVFIIQSTCFPVNNNVMELLIMIDAFKRASAEKITVVLPYYGYARQDCKVTQRAPISAKLIADLITVAGAHRVLSLDLHADQIQGFFNIPVDNLFATSVLLDYFKNRFINNQLVIVSPDVGGIERARNFAKKLNAAFAIIDKHRNLPNESQVMNIIGNVNNMIAIILDDMIDTAGTIVKSADVILKAGAREVYACCSHPILSGLAVEKLEKSMIKKVIVTDSIPLNLSSKKCSKIKVLTVSGILSEAVRRIYYNNSVSSLFI